MTWVQKVRQDFPILDRKINGKRLSYLDNAATSQKPRPIIQKVTNYYEQRNANVHRGVYTLAEEATEDFENARKTVAEFLNAPPEEVIFTRNASEALNLGTHILSQNLEPGDEILLSPMEHHSHHLPWQQMAKRKGCKLIFLPLEKNGISLSSIESHLAEKTKILAITMMANATGARPPVREIVKLAHDHNTLVSLDGAQYLPHGPANVKKLNPDALSFTGHKMLAPMGIGVLTGKTEHLESAPPLMFGGEMIKSVSKYDATWNDIPWKFEAGTPNVGGAVGLSAAITYLNDIGWPRIDQHERKLTKRLIALLEKNECRLFLPEDNDHFGIVSFLIDDIHPHDVASILDTEGIAVRAGHHCAQPLMNELHVPATTRASIYIYNNETDIDQLEPAIKKVKTILGN